MSAGMATQRPATVQIRASAMPPESARGSPMPPASMALKERMIPVTVPSSPRSGETPAMVPSVLRKRSSSCTTCRRASASRPISISRGRWRLARPVARSLPRGEFCSSAAITLSLIWFDSISCHTRCGSSWGSTRLSCNVHRRSRMMAAAVIEHRMLGRISGPPARTISHILRDLRLQAPHHTGGAGALKALPAHAPCDTSPPGAFWYSPSIDAAAPETYLPCPAHAPGALVPAPLRRAARGPAAVDAASARRNVRLRGGTGDLLRAAPGARDPGDHHRGHLAAQHPGDRRHHLPPESLHRGAGVLRRLPPRRGAAARAAPTFPLRRELGLVPQQPGARMGAVHRRLHLLRAARGPHRLAVARDCVALAGDQPLPHAASDTCRGERLSSTPLGSAALAECAALQLVDPIQALGELEVVGHHHEARSVLAIELQHERQHAGRVRLVEISGRLGREHDARLRHERARHRRALPLASRELVGPVREPLAEAHALEQPPRRGARDSDRGAPH